MRIYPMCQASDSVEAHACGGKEHILENNNTLEKTDNTAKDPVEVKGDVSVPVDELALPLADATEESDGVANVRENTSDDGAEIRFDTLEDEPATERVRRPLVLPEEDPAERKRPAVTEDDLCNGDTEGRSRPAVTFEDVETEGERQIHDGRITGEKHTEASTAAPVRTRTPEKNREVTNGIPVRHPTHSAASAEEGVSEEEWKNKGKFTLVSASIAALCVILMLTIVVVAVNRAYDANLARPADFSMNLLSQSAENEIADIADFGTQAVGEETQPLPETVDETIAESDVASLETTPATEPEDTATLPAEETLPAQTVATETEVPETNAPETAAPAARYTVTIQAYNREPITVAAGSMTVRELFGITGFQLLENDRMYVELDSVITEDMLIVVDSVEYRTVDKTESIPFTSVTNEVQTIPRGETHVAVVGEEGQTTYTYNVEFINGQEVARTLVNETVTKEPVTEVLETGIGGVLVGADGVTYSYSYYRVVPATYYNIQGLTWAGTEASENTVATNFNYIPLGTRLYVKNDRFDFGVRTVEDTGTMEGYEVDIWIGDSNPQLADFAYIGYHYDMVIYYLD